MKFREALEQYKELHEQMTELTNQLAKANRRGNWSEAIDFYDKMHHLYSQIEKFENRTVSGIPIKPLREKKAGDDERPTQSTNERILRECSLINGKESGCNDE